ncbi:hypothetical protein BH18ACT9_BH18ACT9_03100 [soil metagenome]
MKRPRRGKDLGTLGYGFAIVGTQKSGTTSLSALLDEHRNILRAPRKEMHYFDDEKKDWVNPDFSDYVADRKSPAHQVLGDATPAYLWWPQALERMRRYNPDILLIAIFRDPLERLFSQWVMTVNRWPKAAPDWPVFLTQYRPSTLPTQIPEGVHTGGYSLRSGVARGYYGAQLERGFSLFDREQWHLLEFKAFLSDYRTVLDGLTGFLGLPPFTEHPLLPHSMRNKPQAAGTAPTGVDIEGLLELYREDFKHFKQLSDLEVSHWPTQKLLDGTLRPEDLAAKFAEKVVPPAHAAT